MFEQKFTFTSLWQNPGRNEKSEVKSFPIFPILKVQKAHTHTQVCAYQHRFVVHFVFLYIKEPYKKFRIASLPIYLLRIVPYFYVHNIYA